MRDLRGHNHLEFIYLGAYEDGFDLLVHADDGGGAFEELCLPPGGHLDRLALSLAVMLRVMYPRTFSDEGLGEGEGEERGGVPRKWGAFRDVGRKHGSAPSIDPTRKSSRICHPGANRAGKLMHSHAIGMRAMLQPAPSTAFAMCCVHGRKLPPHFAMSIFWVHTSLCTWRGDPGAKVAAP
jgi:hypothetical protein